MTALVVLLAAVMLVVVLWLYDTRGHVPTPEGAVVVVPIWLIDYQRQTIWAHAIDMAMRSPWFGNGINVINLLPGADAPIPHSQLKAIPSHPHNWLIEVFAETGVFGAISLVVLVTTLCFKKARDYWQSRNDAMLAALLVNVGYWASGLLSFSLWSAWWQVSYLLMTALCLTGWKCGNTD